MAYTCTTIFGKRLEARMEPWLDTAGDLARLLDAIGQPYQTVLELAEEEGEDGQPSHAYRDLVSGNAQLLYYWRLQEFGGPTATDSADKNNGTYVGSFKWGQSGPTAEPDFSAEFDGATTEVTTAKEGAAPTEFTIEVLFKCIKSSTASQRLVGFRKAASHDRELYVGKDGKLHFYSGTVLTAAAPCADEKWHYAAATVNATGTATLTLDAAAPVEAGGMAGAAYEGTWVIGGTVDQSGQTEGTNPEWLKGNLAEVAIYTAPQSKSLLAQHQAAVALAPYIPAYGKLLDPVRCPYKDLPYLAQFVGEELPKTAPEAEARERVKMPAGRERGTLQAIETAIKRILKTGKFTIQERTALSGAEAAYHFNVLVEIGKVTKALETAIEEVTPAGVFFSVLELKNPWLVGAKKWSEVPAGKTWTTIKEGEY